MTNTIVTIEADVVAALKARDALTAGTLRMLIARLKNEQIAAGSPLDESGTVRIIQSEHKRRKEAAAEYERGGRPELAEKELAEAAVLERYLPAQVGEVEIAAAFEELSAGKGWTAKDMGVAVKALKERFGAAADGALLARIAKEKLTA